MTNIRLNADLNSIWIVHREAASWLDNVSVIIYSHALGDHVILTSHPSFTYDSYTHNHTLHVSPFDSKLAWWAGIWRFYDNMQHPTRGPAEGNNHVSHHTPRHRRRGAATIWATGITLTEISLDCVTFGWTCIHVMVFLSCSCLIVVATCCFLIATEIWICPSLDSSSSRSSSIYLVILISDRLLCSV